MRFFKIAFTLLWAATLSTSLQAQSVPDMYEGDIVYGDANAPVTVIEYASFTCPHCAHFATDYLPKLKEGVIASGKVKLIFRNFVRDQADMAVALTVRCTTEVEKAKLLSETFFAEQNDWIRAPNPIVAIGSAAYTHGISFPAYNRCQSNKDLMNKLVEKMKEGHAAYEINSVPTFIINGVKSDHKNFDELIAKIQLAVGE